MTTEEYCNFVESDGKLRAIIESAVNRLKPELPEGPIGNYLQSLTDNALIKKRSAAHNSWDCGDNDSDEEGAGYGGMDYDKEEIRTIDRAVSRLKKTYIKQIMRIAHEFTDYRDNDDSEYMSPYPMYNAYSRMNGTYKRLIRNIHCADFRIINKEKLHGFNYFAGDGAWRPVGIYPGESVDEWLRDIFSNHEFCEKYTLNYPYVIDDIRHNNFVANPRYFQITEDRYIYQEGREDRSVVYVCYNKKTNESQIVPKGKFLISTINCGGGRCARDHLHVFKDGEKLMDVMEKMKPKKKELLDEIIRSHSLDCLI
jgi:hypothetical protein